MNSRISAAVANLYMDFFEELVLSTVPVKPWLWKSCADDTCCIMKCTAEVLLDHLNSMRPSIKFIVEVEKVERVLFLGTLLQRKENSSL